MKWFGLLLLSCILCSCTCATATHDIVAGVNTQLAALEESLPVECKTKAIQLQIDGIQKQTDGFEKSCDLLVNKMRGEKIKWQTAFFGLLLIIGLWFGRKIIFR